MRLQKFLAQAGVASRRKSEEFITDGKIKINGTVSDELGVSVDENKDKVEYAGQVIKLEHAFIYIMLNKPLGFICSSRSRQGETVLDLIDIQERVYPVGRLDKDSRGLVLLTNDGELTNQITHPKFGSIKEYEVAIDKTLDKRDIRVLNKGMILDGKKLQPVKVTNDGKVLKLTLTEGVNRQIRRMLGQLGYRVFDLKRIQVGKLSLGGLKEGDWKYINKIDVI